MSLALNIDYSTVLQSIGSNVKTTLPANTACPLCGGIMSVLPNENDIWVSCSKCKFHGDSILLYQTVKKIPDINSAIQEIIQFGGVIGKADFEECSNYISSVVAPMESIDQFYKEATQTLDDGVGGRYGNLLQQYNVYRPWSPTEGMPATSKWLGALPKGTTMFSSNAFTTNALSSQGSRYRNALIMPFYTLPGRISGFQVFAAQRRDFKIFTGYGDQEPDGGLAMLDTVTIGEELVYATDEPVLALQMQIRFTENHQKEIPMVVFNAETSDTWSILSAKKVVFFSPEGISIELVKHAMRFANGHVSRYHDRRLRSYTTGHSINKVLKGTSPEEILGSVDTYSMHWARAMKELLLKNLHTIPETLLKLDLELSHKEALKLECSTQEWDILNRYLQDNLTLREVVIDGKPILERPDGYWVRSKTGRVERISNLFITLDKVVRMRRADKTIYSGNIKIAGYSIPFTEDGIAFTTGPKVAKWLENKVLDSGCPVFPVLHRMWKNRMFEIAKLFNPPRVELGAEKIEWDESTDSAIFPWFRIAEGEFISNRNNALGDDSIPFGKLKLPFLPPSSNDLGVLFHQKYTSTLFPMVLHMCRNFLAPKFDYAPQALFTNSDRLVNKMELAGLLMQDKDDISAFPSIVPEMDINIIEGPSKNLIAMQSEIELLATGLRPNTAILLEDVDPTASVMDIAQRFIVFFLRWVSKHSIEYDRETTPTEFVLNAMKEFLIGMGQSGELPEDTFKSYQSHELETKNTTDLFKSIVECLGELVGREDIKTTQTHLSVDVEWVKGTVLQLTGLPINEFSLVQGLMKEGNKKVLKEGVISILI